ncbi:MAG: hypothetical protein KHW74_09425 [Veillonella sp.]|nr:hypothetical protein [Veillonella sp.]
MNQVKFMENVGKVATVTAVAMYVSYFPQIMHNLAHPGDIPVALANAPGIFFGLAAAITAIM